MENDVILKKSLFGGFDRNEVMEYIGSLQMKASLNKAELAELENLKKKVVKLESEIIAKDNEIIELTQNVEKAKEAAKLRQVPDSSMQESMDNADQYVENAKDLVKNISDRTADKVVTARGRIEVLMDWLGAISDSVLDLYSSLSHLKGEYDTLKTGYDNAFCDYVQSADTPSEETSEPSDVEPKSVEKKASTFKVHVKPHTTKEPEVNNEESVNNIDTEEVENDVCERVEEKAEETQESIEISDDGSSIPDEKTIELMREAEQKYRNMLKK